MHVQSTFTSVAALLCLSAVSFTAAHAQALPAGEEESAAATANDSGTNGIIPYTRGYNISVVTASQHDSADGWSSILTPDAAYRFNHRFSVDFALPVFAVINTIKTTGTAARPVVTPQTSHGLLGDASLVGHVDSRPLRFFDDSAAFTLGLPTGDATNGLGAGKVTYDFNNHVEKSFGILTPDVEFGIGDSSSLLNERIRKNYVATGTLAHFQIGASVDLPYHMSFEADAYEQLPLTRSTVTTTTGKGKRKTTTTSTTGAAEDNGFYNSLDIPLAPHVTLSGFYNRSLRAHNDVGGFSLTFLLKAPPTPTELGH